MPPRPEAVNAPVCTAHPHEDGNDVRADPEPVLAGGGHRNPQALLDATEISMEVPPSIKNRIFK